MIKNMSKFILSFLIILILSTRGLIVYADIIYEPNDSFYHSNYEKMKHLGREYRANGADGTITVYKEPPSMEKVTTFENGTIFFVSYTYTSILGTKWGVIEYSNDTDSKVNIFNRKSGWVKMDDLSLVYDDISFHEDYQNEFNNYNNEFDTIKDTENLILWTYPGSGVIKSIFNIVPNSLPEFSHTYTDENNRVWGQINYYMGIDGWFCFSAPLDENLPKTIIESDSLNNSSQNIYNIMVRLSQNNKAILIISIVLVSGIVIITSLLIRKFWPNNDIDKK